MPAPDMPAADDSAAGGRDPTAPSRSARSAAGRRVFWFSTIAGALVTTFLVLLIWALAARSGAKQLTQADYEGALARWEKNGPASYNLDLELSGNRPGVIHVEVRDGQATRMTRDGVEPRQKRTWDYWTVPGQFDTIGEELEMARDPAKSYAVPGASRVVLWAEFDERYGFPKRFDRVVLGADLEVHWKVTRFEAARDGN